MYRFVRKNASQIGILSVLILMMVVFIFAAPKTFQSKEIYASLMFSVPLYGIVALPLTMVVIAGEIDLSFGSIMAVGMVGFWTVYDKTSSIELAFVASLIIGFLVGGPGKIHDNRSRATMSFSKIPGQKSPPISTRKPEPT